MSFPDPCLDDPFDLRRFVQAQAPCYAQVMAELRAGRKQSHWSWFILPQLRGLGSSPMAVRYAITSLDEARAYLAHPLLGARLIECVAAINAHRDARDMRGLGNVGNMGNEQASGKSAAAILGDIDALKFRSCVTLFRAAADADGARENQGRIFGEALERFFAGQPDPATLALLRQE
jgi:uncharacterized protein (DUF1810 family)